MGEKKPNPVTIDGVEYDANEFTEQQRVLFNHVIDLDRKVANALFNLDQLNVGKESFIRMLKESLTKPAAEEPPQQ